MKKFTFYILLNTVFTFLLVQISIAQQYQIIPVTGFNQDLIAEGSGGTHRAMNTTTVSFDQDVLAGGNHVMYAKNFRGDHNASTAPPYGIDNTGFIISANNTNIRYQLANYTSNNAVFLKDLNSAGTLTFGASGVYTALSILASSAEGASSFTIRVNFSDGTYTDYTFNVPDWYGGTGYTIQGIGRVQRVSDGTDDYDVFDGDATNPRLYDCNLSMSATDKIKLITGITITKTSSSGRAAILAVSGQITTSVPGTPTATAGTNVLSTSFTANWTAVDNTTSYKLDVSTNESFSALVTGYNNLDVGNATSKSVTGLTSGTQYFYRVRAANANGQSFNSNTISVGGLSAPAATDATSTTTTSFSANWGTVTGATSYRLDVATDFYFQSLVSGYSNLNVDNVSTYPVTGLTSGVTYYYRVRAVNTSYTSMSSNIVSTGLPVPPVTTYATNILGTSFTANWAFVTATSYKIDVSTSSTFSTFVTGYNNLDVGNVNNYSVTGLTSGVTYYYRLRSVNSSGSSVNSNVVTATTVSYIIKVNASAGVSGPTNYSTLKAAFDAINLGTHMGNITIQVCGSTTETASAVLNASNPLFIITTSGANYTSVVIYSTISGLSITGNLTAPLIDLNGADNVTINGSVNASGSSKDLVISNTSTSANSGTSTIRMYNGANNNTIKYCTVKGSSTDNNGGVIFLSATAANTGNLIDNNNITNASDANRPLNAIYSGGAANTVTISSNNIYDYLSRVSSSNGVNLNTSTGASTISGNSFYETNTFSPTANRAYYYPIYINSSAAGFTVSGNYIGGNAPLCSGTWTKSNTAFSNLCAINLNSVGTGTPSVVKGNTVNGINWSNNNNDATWQFGILVSAGDVTIGASSEPNTIGSITGTPNLSFTFESNGNIFVPFYLNGSGYITCQYNNIGGITCNNTNSASVTRLYCIYRGNNNANAIISNNTIGSSTNPVTLTSPATGDVQYMIGICNNNSAATGLTMNNNTISYLNNQTTGSSAGYVCGILSYDAAAPLTISGNNIHDLTIANTNGGGGRDASMRGGIWVTTGYQLTVTNNTVYNLTNTNSSFNGYMYGIYATGGGTSITNDCSGNTVYNISATGTSAGPFIYGIYFNAYNYSTNTVARNYIYGLSCAGITGNYNNTRYYGIYKPSSYHTITYANNIISLGNNNISNIYGIYHEGSSGYITNVYFNTIYISGNPTVGGLISYALYSSGNDTRTFKNNVLNNARSNNGGVGNHYCIYYGSTPAATSDYNDLYAPGTSGYIGFYNGTYSTTINSWRTATGGEANTLNINPLFASPGGTNAADYKPWAALLGAGGTGITTDYIGTTRSASSPLMGAWEVAVPPPVPVLLSPLSGSIGNALSPNLLWNKSVGATGYNAVIATDSLFTGIVVNDSTLTDSIKTVSGLSLQTKYYWKVRAKNVVGWGSFSSAYNFKTIGTASQVVLSTPANNTTSQPVNLTFKWFKAVDLIFAKNIGSKSKDAENIDAISMSYWYELASDSTFSAIITRDSSLIDTNKVVSNLSYNTNYFWRVKAKNTIGWGSFSSIWKFTTTVPPNILVTATAGTTSGGYNTLKAAFDAINAGTHRGTLQVKINSNTTEITTATLNASGTGSASYSSINMYPTATGLTITGSIAAPLIDLNGADSVVIDGRVNQTGTTADLTISNASTSNMAGTSTIRLINSASFNTVKYCYLKGSSRVGDNGVGGMVFFSTSTGTSGNNSNAISYNNITNAGGNRPNFAIGSAGSSINLNTGNIISYNHFYDYLNFQSGNTTMGINIYSYSTGFTIQGNAFYESTSLVPIQVTAATIISLYTGSGHTVSGNFIGGSADSCGGTALTKTNGNTNQFVGIYLRASDTTANSIQGNTIKNISVTNVGKNFFYGMYIESGTVNIGNITANKIGDSTGTGSITLTNGIGGNGFYGITLLGSGNKTISNNVIGSITTGNSASTASTDFYGLNISGSAPVTVANNTIGSKSTSNSINLTSASTTDLQKVHGIYIDNSSTNIISSNSIANITNGTTSSSSSGFNIGIYTSSGINTVSGNEIKNLKISNNNNASSVSGITLSSGSAGQNLSNNTIYNLSNDYPSYTGNVSGIYYSGGTSGTVSGNFIYNLSANTSSTGASLYGIQATGGTTVYSNNIISLNGNNWTELYGINDVSGTNSFYFNTVYIYGSTPAGNDKSSFCLYSMGTNTHNIRNNLFINNRISGVFNVCIGIRYTNNLISDYNNFYFSGANTALGYLNGSKATLAAWIYATGKDSNSFNVNPILTSAGGTIPTDYTPNTGLPGVSGTGITTDYSNNARAALFPTIGAFEIPVPGLISPVSRSIGNPVNLNLVWSKPVGAINYYVIAATDTGFTNIAVNDSTLTDTLKTVSNLNAYTTYYWKVRAKTSAGWNAYSQVSNFKTVGMASQVFLSTPANNAVSQPVSLTFKWYKAADLTFAKNIGSKSKNSENIDAISMSYWYELASDSTFSTITTRDSTLIDTNNVVSNLSYNTKYYWRVKAKNAVGWGTFSSIWKFTTVLPVPAAPTLLSPLNNSINNLLNLNLVWNKPQYATGYNILVSSSSVFTTTIINDSTLTDSVKAVSGLLNGTTYYWKVRARNSSGWGAYSSVNNFTTLGSPSTVILSLPANSAVNQSINLTFKWFKANDNIPMADPKAITNYWYELASDSLFASIILRDSTLTDTTASVTSLSYITKYYWRVKAKNPTGWGIFSSVWNFTTVPPAPVAPTLLTPANNSVDLTVTPVLDWNDVTYATSYRVQASTSSVFSTTVYDSAGLTLSTITVPSGKLTTNTQYYWRVSATNISGTSAYSPVWNFTTSPNTPNVPQLIYPANNSIGLPLSIVFRWYKAIETITDNKGQIANNKEQTTNNEYDSPKALNKYWFECSTDSTFASVFARDTALTGADTTVVVSGLVNYTKYYWRVKGKNQTGWGSFSVVWNYTTVVTAPVAPTLLTPANNSVDLSVTPTLDWNDVTYAASYRAQVSTSSAFTTTVYDSAGLTPSTITVPSGKLTTNTQYYWRVNATNAAGTSAYSTVWNFTTSPNEPDVPLLAQPANNVTGQPTSLTFKWHKAIEQITDNKGQITNNKSGKSKGELSDSPDAISKYWFEYATDSTFTTVIARDSSLTDTTKSVTGLSTLTKYYWRVKGKNQTGWGGFSAVWNFTTILPVPAAPTLKYPENNSVKISMTPLLDWLNSPTAVSYRVQVSLDSTFSTTVFDTSGVTVSEAPVPAGKLNPSVKYYWRVNATNAGGTGSWSTVNNFKTTANIFLNLKVYLEGFWIGSNQVQDSVTVYLARTTAPFAFADTAKVLLSGNGTALINFALATNGSYYIVVSHRNHLETWSKVGQSFTSNITTNFDFTTSATQAYGDNMKQVGSDWVLYGGDANGDGAVDANDVPYIMSQFGMQGYLAADFNGDNDVNASDIALFIPNFGVTKIVPSVVMVPVMKTKDVNIKNSEVRIKKSDDKTNKIIKNK